MASIKKLSGVTIAMAAAGLLLSGNAIAAEKGKSEEGTVHCAGINSCKGQTSCKSATNDCKGKNSCKGHGWLSVSKEECEKKGGKIISKM
jgi:hypothetical protein